MTNKFTFKSLKELNQSPSSRPMRNVIQDKKLLDADGYILTEKSTGFIIEESYALRFEDYLIV